MPRAVLSLRVRAPVRQIQVDLYDFMIVSAYATGFNKLVRTYAALSLCSRAPDALGARPDSGPFYSKRWSVPILQRSI
jgi:hypothetical protein